MAPHLTSPLPPPHSHESVAAALLSARGSPPSLLQWRRPPPLPSSAPRRYTPPPAPPRPPTPSLRNLPRLRNPRRPWPLQRRGRRPQGALLLPPPFHHHHLARFVLLSPSLVEAAPPAVNPDAFEKEMMGLTGGFPGGEVGLKDFVAKNPPPLRARRGTSKSNQQTGLAVSGPPRPPELPLFLPGMVVLVKNPNNAYHNYCGIVQRVTDGKVGVLFEGGNWDRLITFNLDELEGREKGPPMVNPKSVVLEALVAELGDDDEEAKAEKREEGAAAPA
ncbi:hypothetical protein PR202_gb07692 [Eleusine coracana subsp. coracana]|uniref:NAD(P)H-quinone oxidoreductase subunit S, chloroplastic n=1 Tax=Eleusine coracana subsp. coracana TaxID=191504 RepID=A0AAV5EDQ1_ELECO|nr:hypothetical protein PR202_gb07692 [Eleusine coracana subsp. coracana]